MGGTWLFTLNGLHQNAGLMGCCLPDKSPKNKKHALQAYARGKKDGSLIHSSLFIHQCSSLSREGRSPSRNKTPPDTLGSGWRTALHNTERTSHLPNPREPSRTQVSRTNFLGPTRGALHSLTTCDACRRIEIYSGCTYKHSKIAPASC